MAAGKKDCRPTDGSERGTPFPAFSPDRETGRHQSRVRGMKQAAADMHQNRESAPFSGEIHQSGTKYACVFSGMNRFRPDQQETENDSDLVH